MNPFNHPVEGLGTELLPSAAHMRHECLERAWDDVHATFSERELQVIQILFCNQVRTWSRSKECDGPICKDGKHDWRSNPGLAIIERDTTLLVPLSKWYLLATWLTPESAVGYVPALVFDIVDRALTGTLSN